MEKEITVTFKTTERNLEAFLGAVELGSLLEHWCSIWCQSAINTYDTMSYRWYQRVEEVKKQIKDKIGINSDWKGYGEEEDILELIDKFVIKESDKNCKYWNEDVLKELELSSKMINNDKDE